MFERLAGIDTDADEATLVECIAELEHLKCVAAAGQVRLTAALDQKRRAREAAAGVPAAKRGRGVASEIALARHDSPNRGGRHLGFARALMYEMPHTLAALEAGALSGVAGHPDRARVGLPEHRGPPGTRRADVRGPVRAGRQGRQRHRNKGQSHCLRTRPAGGGGSGRAR